MISEILLIRTNGIRLPDNFTKIHKANISAKESIAAKDGSVTWKIARQGTHSSYF
jgi:hypothetical protein